MASFYLEYRGRPDLAWGVHSDLSGEVFAHRNDALLMMSWGDPSIRIDQDAVRRALIAGTSPDIAGRSVLLMDKRTGATTVAVDRFGLYPAVVCRTPSGIAVASDLATLARHRPAAFDHVDADGFAMQLAIGQTLGTRTIWSQVRHLPGGSVFVREPGTNGTIRERKALRLPSRPVDRRDALDRLVDAVDRRLKAADGTMIPLSGGLDSRLLLACALAAGHRPDTFSYGAAGSADLQIAEALARQAGTAFSAGLIENATIAAHALDVARAGGGEVPVQHGHAILGAHALPDTIGRPVLTGTGSETFRAFYYDRGLPGMSALGADLFTSRLRPHAMRWVEEHMAAGRLDALSAHAPALSTRLTETLRDRIGATLDTAGDTAHGLDAVYLDLRVGRFVSAGQQLLNRLHPRMHPFLDTDVVAGLSGLPVAWKTGARFHRWAIQKLAPGLADVDWDRTGRPLSMGLSVGERWPGLAARLGLRASYAKSGAPIADYRGWAETVDVSATTATVLRRGGLSEAAGRPLADWIASLDRVHAAGILTAVDRAVGSRAVPLKEAA
ncbi:MAG: asparagine synthase-related protein [Thalassobaculaceae bacterium]